ncbi:MAG: helix-turn-helix transcriptional regulator [Solidesulfovibrio sp. DCME]|uniref:helix-turn-helix transcriptional regulator n=1 Tax=Solidesulfovibrio sp. DCME TaxID=3447380 RepID=UPI003D14B6A9
MSEVTRAQITDGYVDLHIRVKSGVADAVEAAIRQAIEDTETYGPEEVFGPRNPGRLVRGGRTREGWTQVELAKRLGVSKTVVSDLEHGRRPISKKMAAKLAEVFGSSPLVFLV